MRTLADQLVKRALPGDAVAAGVAAQLSRPSKNHSAVHIPAVERFIFDKSSLERLWMTHCEDRPEITLAWLAAYGELKTPFPTCWIEVHDIQRGMGFYVSGGVVIWFAKLKNGFVFEAGSVDLADLRALAQLNTGLQFMPGASFKKEFFTPEVKDEFLRTFSAFALLCVCIASPRAATTERIITRQCLDDAKRRHSSRRAQRGRPVFSFNRVRLKIPKPSIQRGEVFDSVASSSKRGHWVIGHWRLIDGVLEPYWTWVESHKKGNEALGFVTKEREISFDPSAMRRGFLIPQTVGRKGLRIKAAPTEVL